MGLIPQIGRALLREATRDWTPAFGDHADRPGFDVFAPPNWLPTLNRYGLAAPPVPFLLKLWNYDAELRILASSTKRGYLLARRTRLPILKSAIGGGDSDTGRCRRERLLPIVYFRAGIVWNDDVFEWLDARDSWKHTNAYKDVGDCVEEVERAEQDRIQRASDDDGYQRGISAWNALKMRTGQRVFVHEPAWSLSDVIEPSGARGPQSGDSHNGDQSVECHPRQASSAGGDS